MTRKIDVVHTSMNTTREYMTYYDVIKRRCGVLWHHELDWCQLLRQLNSQRRQKLFLLLKSFLLFSEKKHISWLFNLNLMKI